MKTGCSSPLGGWCPVCVVRRGVSFYHKHKAPGRGGGANAKKKHPSTFTCTSLLGEIPHLMISPPIALFSPFTAGELRQFWLPAALRLHSNLRRRLNGSVSLCIRYTLSFTSTRRSRNKYVWAQLIGLFSEKRMASWSDRISCVASERSHEARTDSSLRRGSR